MFTETALQIAREILLVGGAVAIILVCFVLVACLRILWRISRMSQDVEEVIEKTLWLLLQPLTWLHTKLVTEDWDGDHLQD